MKNFQERVISEKKELDEKLESLKRFFYTDIFNSLDEPERNRLEIQCDMMSAYSRILDARIKAFNIMS
jgi:hypothetical protein